MGITIREADLERELPLLASTVNAAFGMQRPRGAVSLVVLGQP